ncbi:alanine/ornithine racemase family PLP-dependent enzyme [Sedimentibacter sp. zth1]|uniref:ornithine racemase Orr n=1 Tax=Sedimentibacter sp. zth1 TaxID=2816908 RepID=UPI001A93A8EC|nr:ornithine racemase Orr [Sedimentibacter sp. zth1]QSX06065.1 alanine/ornithine racemase family PLP-dependent enzyme [Sedimentibacter sp. zth1]
MYPRLLIDLNKIEHNLEIITDKVTNAGCSIMIVTKVVCADEKIARIVDKNEKVEFFADSRIENLESYQYSNKQKVLLRLPMISDVERVVKYSDISLNSELEIIKCLNIEAKKQNKTHKIILMIDLGDLREGLYYTDKKEIFRTVEEIIKLESIELYGLGVNLSCYGAVIPQVDNLNVLVGIAQEIEDKFNMKFKMISGGNSSSLYLIDKKLLPRGISNLRIGEAFFLANETAYSNKIENMHDDTLILQAEIIELKEKPSIPVGEIGVDAFGKKPHYEDRGIIKRAILAIGKQDIDIESIVPLDCDIDVLGASSDHMILDVSKSKTQYKLGDIISFKLGYMGTLRAFTSKYIDKQYID